MLWSGIKGNHRRETENGNINTAMEPEAAGYKKVTLQSVPKAAELPLFFHYLNK